jgi:tetratricopeptide (TPR) repeat protein
MKNWFLFIVISFISLVISSCSTERNTLLSRTYHSTTAHYNGYFNANDLLRSSLTQYQNGLKENYYTVLPIRPLPNEEEVKALYTPIDTAISKCTKVIQRHAMPSMDKPSLKKDEHNTWIDENWLTIGIANYYRRNYDGALKNLEYAKKFFATDKTAYFAEMWIARVHIEEGRYTEAILCLNNLDSSAEAFKQAEEEKKSEKSNKKKPLVKKGKKSATDEKTVAPFPKTLLFDLAVTKAMLSEKKNDKEGMIKALTEAIPHAKKSTEKARLHFVLAQLQEQKGDRQAAALNYAKVLKYNASFEMSFNARLKKALNAGGEKVVKDLNKLLRDTKNAEFKDQIFYTLAQISYNDGDVEKAIEHYTSSAFYSNTNKYQKGLSYEKLGDIFFGRKLYVPAQKYYDSCAKVIPENYPNFIGVKNKAEKLQALVKAIETATYEDSVQRIAALSPEDQLAFAKDLVKKIKSDEARRKKQEAEKLALLQAERSNAPATGNGSKFYWNNEKAKTEGFEEFKRQWGQRVNEDDWRRSDKIVFATFNEPEKDSLAPEKEQTEAPIDSLTAESLLAKLPSSDSALQLSRERMMEAYFNAGQIYQEQLNEKELAEKQYLKIVDQTFEDKHKLLAAFQLYKLYDPSDAKAIAQRDYILLYYPTSDYAGFLRDPDYFIRKKERQKETENDYLKDLDRYERGLYSIVISKANSIINNEKDNPFRPKYYLLKAKSQAKIYEDKKMVLPTLNDLLAAYPGTDEAKSAQKMKDIIEKGYSTNTPVDFTKKGLFTYKENEPMSVLIFLDEKVNGAVAKNRVIDFNKEFFSRGKLNTSSKLFGEKSVILVKEFDDETEAAEYLRIYKKTKKHLMDMQKFKIVYISQENMKLLFETQKLAEYELFFDEFY